MEMIHKLRPDYDTGLQGSELDTMRGTKKGQEEGGQGGLLGGGDIQAETQMSSWLCEDVGVGWGLQAEGTEKAKLQDGRGFRVLKNL